MNASERGLRGFRNGATSMVLLAGLLTGLGGCAELNLEPGLSGRDAEWARVGAPDGADDFSVVSSSHDRAVVSALGHQIAVEPANGFCLAQEAIETSERSAFLLLGDCAIEDPAGNGLPVEGRLDLPRGVPGIITVSISGDPGFSRLGSDAGDLADLQAFVESPDGRALLGRGGDGNRVSVADSRRIGSTLYVLVEDADGGVPVLAPRFWRAFVELNERLAVVTISGFRDSPLPEEEMLRHLGDQVRQLQVANSEPVNEVPIQLAERAAPAGAAAWPFSAPRTEEQAIADEAIEEGADDRAASVTGLKPASIIVASESGEQGFWPLPERRGAWRSGQRTPPAQGGPDASGDVDAEPDDGATFAPAKSPLAPWRP